MQGTILTNIGVSKIAIASPETPVVISQIAVGDGGGGYPSLNPASNTLVNEVWRGDASFPIREGVLEDTLMFEGLIPRTEGGFTVREVAIFDADGDMIAIGQTNEIVKPVPNGTQGLVITVRLRVTLSNASDATVIITESVNYDHRQLTFRTADNAHPASAINLSQGKDVQEWIDTSSVITTAQVLVVGEDNFLTSEVTHTLPSTTGLVVGSKIYLSKSSSISPTITVNGGNTEKILIGKDSGSQQPFDDFIYNINAGVVLRWNGTNWELM